MKQSTMYFAASAVGAAATIAVGTTNEWHTILLSALTAGSFLMAREKRQVETQQAEVARTSEALRNAAKVAEALVTEHFDVLLRKHLQLVCKDDYGQFDFSDWNRELEIFYESVVKPRIWRDLAAAGIFETDETREQIGEVIFKSFYDLWEKREAEGRHEVATALPPPTEPLAFESWCAQQLRSVGWEARTTKASGDQGADVIAEKGGRRLVLQCKLYTSDVGNAAVQEVSAARTHYGATDAAVVATTGYTKAARQLAASNGVHLLHSDALPGINKILGLPSETIQ